MLLCSPPIPAPPWGRLAPNAERATATVGSMCRASAALPGRALSLTRPSLPRGLSARNSRGLGAFSLSGGCGVVTRASVAESVIPAGVESSRHVLPDGKALEVLKAGAKGGKPTGPPLVFVHGSYHGAWCWAPHFLPYFAERGHDVYAVSLRGHGKSDRPEGAVAGSLGSHTDDLAHFVGSLASPPVMMGHSFSGLFVMEYFARGSAVPPLAGGGVLASTPPSGNAAMITRFLKRDFIKSMKLTYSMVARGFEKSVPLCRDSFFSASMPEAQVELYQAVLKEQSGVRLLDLKQLPDELPVAPPPAGAPPMLVLGAEDDFLVDREGSEESAAQYGTQAVILPDLAHDVMLDVGWERAAEEINGFLQRL